MMPPMSAEATVVRNYIDWILALPWGDLTEDNLDSIMPSRCSTRTTTASRR
jgi:ATP-dependent Lon protease